MDHQKYEGYAGEFKAAEDFAMPDDAASYTAQMDKSDLRRHRTKQNSSDKESIDGASSVIRRRDLSAGHFVALKRLTLNEAPLQCDVVIEFPENAPDDAPRWLLNRIKSHQPEGLDLHCSVKVHESTKRTAFCVAAPINVLFKAAEEHRLPKRLKPELGGALRDFTTRESHCFELIKDGDGKLSLFTSQERQWLVLQVLQSIRASSSDALNFQGRANVEEGQSVIAAWEEAGAIEQFFPMHEPNALKNLKSSWLTKFFAPHPIDEIACYFGVKVALYFAWFSHYTLALCAPAFFGTLLWAVLYDRSQTAQDVGHVIFSLFIVAWASLYLEAWRRCTVELSNRCGTFSTPSESAEPPRPLCKGSLEESPTTGKLEPSEAPALTRRVFRYFVSFPIIGVCLLCVFIMTLLMLKVQIWFESKLPERGLFGWLDVIPKILLAVAITVSNELFYKLAVWMNDQENFREQSKYENHLIGKVALFQFVNSFSSLFYVAFYLGDYHLLKEQLACLLISRQIIRYLRELSVSNKPEVKPAKDDNPSTPKRLGRAELESSLVKYDGTFFDHIEMLIQMGFVVLFSSAFPLAALFALVSNLIKIRSDAFKLANVYQRPFGQRFANIEMWQNALRFLGLAAIIVNCSVIGLSGHVSRLWPELTQTQTVLLIVTLEHIMLGLQFALKYILPELPQWLTADIIKTEQRFRDEQRKSLSPPASPHTPLSPTFYEKSKVLEKNEHSASNDLEDNVFDHVTPNTPKRFDEFQRDVFFRQNRMSRGSADYEISRKFMKTGATPDTPISQTSTVLCLRPLHESTAGHSVQNIVLDSPSLSACKSNSVTTIKSKISEIPPFRGKTKMSKQNLQNWISSSCVMTSSSPTAKGSPSAVIPEIPSFRKSDNQHSNYSPFKAVTQSTTSTSISVSPPAVPDITTFRKRSSKEIVQIEHDHKSGGAEWKHRLQVADTSPIHRSTECIASKSSADSKSSFIKPAPSLTNISMKIETSGSIQSAAPTPRASIDEEQRAAEIVAKKNRLKSKFVKGARSIAVFSLKLKERRAKEAERVAREKAEEEAEEQAISMCGGGGELMLIPLEHLIRMEDVVNRRPSNS